MDSTNNNTSITINSDHQTMIHIEGENEGRKRAPGGGRKGTPIIYKEVDDYVEGTIISKGNPLIFKIDKEDFEKVNSRQWYAASGGYYVACHISINGVRKFLYMHNFVMNRLTFPGKGTIESVDHINRNGLDNRKSNLRIVTQSQQNINQSQRVRRCILPDGCGITPDDIPRHVWYIKANGLHGDRFGIDLKTENVKWKTTSSKSVTLQDKLKHAKDKLAELYVQFPYLQTDIPTV